MKLPNLLQIFCSLFLLESRAQIIKIDKQALHFQTINEKKTDSLSFIISNSSNFPAEVRLFIPFQVYGSQPYQIKDSVLTIAENDSKTVWVYCKILHNTPNPSNIIIRSKYAMMDGGDLFVKLSCQGKYSKLYYDTTQNLSEEALKIALKKRLIKNANAFSYNVARDKMYDHIDNIADTVTCIYTNRKAKFNTRSGATANNFNCEHTFPQGFFGSDPPMVSDIHHLFSTDENANNSRGNLPFGIATQPLVDISINTPSKKGGGKYEPQDSHKGNCARAMMYFALRYQDYQNFYAPQDAVLRSWHKSFPPLPKDTTRNAAVFADQNNRNPFIDYPQFEARIKNLTGFSQSDSVQKLVFSDSTLGTVFGLPGSAQFGDTSSFVIWNQGNKKIKVSQMHFLNPGLAFFSLVGGNDQSFTLGYNEARKIDYRVLEWGNDSLFFATDDPANPLVKIPAVNNFVSNKALLSKPRPVVFPNPASSEISLDLKNDASSETTLNIFNPQGSLIKSEKILSIKGKASLSLTDLSAGMYQLEIRQNHRIDHLKLVKL
jgi:endonuclease I